LDPSDSDEQEAEDSEDQANNAERSPGRLPEEVDEICDADGRHDGDEESRAGHGEMIARDGTMAKNVARDP